MMFYKQLLGVKTSTRMILFTASLGEQIIIHEDYTFLSSIGLNQFDLMKGKM